MVSNAPKLQHFCNMAQFFPKLLKKMTTFAFSKVQHY